MSFLVNEIIFVRAHITNPKTSTYLLASSANWVTVLYILPTVETVFPIYFFRHLPKRCGQLFVDDVNMFVRSAGTIWAYYKPWTVLAFKYTILALAFTVVTHQSFLVNLLLFLFDCSNRRILWLFFSQSLEVYFFHENTVQKDCHRIVTWYSLASKAFVTTIAISSVTFEAFIFFSVFLLVYRCMRLWLVILTFSKINGECHIAYIFQHRKTFLENSYYLNMLYC